MSTLDPGVTGKRSPLKVAAAPKKPKAKKKKKAEGPRPNKSTETMSIPAAGEKYFNLSRNGSYAAAARGEIPTIQIGKLRRVPIRAMERMLDEAGKVAAD
jgi:hypothetical protein